MDNSNKYSINSSSGRINTAWADIQFFLIIWPLAVGSFILKLFY